MKIYLVGGAVRDQLLGLPVKERDWVVVGATPQEMLDLGYKPVGKDFPVFLHPKTHEEYALARTERKISKGYAGFEFYANPKVTLEEDLKRRDLTINAIAKTKNGKLIDPFNGQRDLKAKILRHVSKAFAEDPVRILRIARFASRFNTFKIYPTTMRLMRTMVKLGEVDALVAERVWQELQRTLELAYSQRFFEILKNCNALKILFPEISRYFAKSLKALQNVATLSKKSTVRFAALTSFLNEQQIKVLCKRNNVPSIYKDLSLLVIKYQKDFYNILNANAEKLLKTLEQLDAFRRPERFADFLLACEARFSKKATLQTKILQNAYKKTAKISVKPLLDKGLTGTQINKQLHEKRKAALSYNRN